MKIAYDIKNQYHTNVALGSSFEVEVEVWDKAGSYSSATNVIYVHGLNLNAIVNSKSNTQMKLQDNGSGPDYIPLYVSSSYLFQFSYTSFITSKVELLLIPIDFGLITSETLGNNPNAFYYLDAYSSLQRRSTIPKPTVYSDTITTWSVSITSQTVSPQDLGEYFYAALVACVPISSEKIAVNTNGDIVSANGYYLFTSSSSMSVTLSGQNIFETYGYSDDTFTFSAKKRIPVQGKNNNNGYCANGELLLVSLTLPVVTINIQ
jgi:hypothetical protein